MIHEITPHRFDNQYHAGQKIEEDAIVLQFDGNTLLFKSSGDELELPRKKDLPEFSDSIDLTFLFTLDDIPCFLVRNGQKIDKAGYVYKEMNFFRTLKQKEIAWAGLVGYDLMSWYSKNEYCGKCGAKTHHKSDERAIECPTCKNLVFPKISPAIIVAVICNNKILLARNSNFPAAWYSLIAGYADIGESLEETVRREVKEEVGIDVTNIRYYKSQPWPLTGSMMVGFVAQADESQPITVDTKEIAEAAWFTRGKLPSYPPVLSIAGEMIGVFDRGELG
jgi:NAD+ diphosphatase